MVYTASQERSDHPEATLSNRPICEKGLRYAEDAALLRQGWAALALRVHGIGLSPVFRGGPDYAPTHPGAQVSRLLTRRDSHLPATRPKAASRGALAAARNDGGEAQPARLHYTRNRGDGIAAASRKM